MASKMKIPDTPLPTQQPREFGDESGLHIPTEVLRSTPDTGPEPTAGALWDAATARHWLSEGVARSRAQKFDQFDDGFEMTPERLHGFQSEGYNERELEFLSEAGSEVNLGHRVERVAQDRKMVATLNAGGWAGTGMELLAGIADPVAIPLLLASGGVAAGTKLNTARAVAASALTGMGQNVALEYALMQNDTQRTVKDVALAGAAGALLGGTLTLAGRTISEMRMAHSQANELDAAHTNQVRNMMEGDSYNHADEALATKVTEPLERKRALSEREVMDTLKAEHGGRVEVESRKAQTKAKDELRAYTKQQTARIAALEADRFLPPSARNKQIAQLQASIDSRVAAFDERASLAQANRELNSTLDQLTNGKVPPQLMPRYKELKGEAGEFDAVVPESIGESLPKRPPPPEEVGLAPETPTPEGSGGVDAEQSMGAMQVARSYKDIATYDDLLSTSDVDEVFEAGRRASMLGHMTARVSRMASAIPGFRSLSTIVDSAPDAGTRGLGIQLFRNGTRTIQGHQSAEELADTLFHRDAVPHYLAQETAFEAYVKEQGSGLFGRNRGKLRETFDNEAVLAQARGEITTTVPQPGDSAIHLAAKARARIYEAGLKNNKDYGVVGFEKIKHSNEYHSVIFDQAKMLNMRDTHADEVVNTIARAYETGGIKLSRENAVRLAHMQIERTTAMQTAGRGVNQKALSMQEFKTLEKELSAKGVDRTIIKELEETLFSKEERELMSPRAMFSLRPNLTAEGGGVRMVDLLDTSMERVMKYGSDAAGNAGLASQGYRSRTQFLRTMEDLRKAAINEVRKDLSSPNKKVAAEAEKAMARLESSEDQNLISDGVSLMFREPLAGASSDALTDVGKTLRKLTAITRLRATGLMTIPEYGNAIIRNGALNTLSKLPSARMFNLSAKSIEQDKFMSEFSKTFSTTGHQEYLFGHKFHQGSDFDDMTRTKLGNLVQKGLGKGMNAAMILNGFRTFQHAGEEMVARAMVGNLQSMVKKGTVTPAIRKSLMATGGISEDSLNQIIAHLKASPEDTFAAVRSLPPKLFNELGTAMRNNTSASFLRMSVGEQNPMAHRELGKFLTSLLSFSIGSYEKLLVRGVTSERAFLAASMAAQSALGYASYIAYVQQRAIGMDERERQKFIDKSMKDDAQIWGVINRVGPLAGPMIPVQMMASMRLLPDAVVQSPNQAGIQPYGGIAAAGLVADYAKAVGAGADQVKAKWSGKTMPLKDYEKDMRDIRRVIPFIDGPIYNATVGQFD
ncbi:hypothetical protein [Pseudomonas phage Njord]|uniref:Internal virion protein n=1 Tax=Pseudomonas phage Njord TaxID=2163985 RepID=A0A2S1GMK4_9CAUD|nr:hypothetical protein HOT08_gp34 [Pseudomonas phage Njord]AWD90622.1 hypothetical protein [Pseudomonas phage Njord]